MRTDKIEQYVDLMGHTAEWIEEQLTAEECQVFYERMRDYWVGIVDTREDEEEPGQA